MAAESMLAKAAQDTAQAAKAALREALAGNKSNLLVVTKQKIYIPFLVYILYNEYAGCY